MQSSSKSCHQCGAPVDISLANCKHCGAQVGTVFSEDAIPSEVHKAQYRKSVAQHVDYYQALEKARDRANNSMILGLASFVPGIGFILGGVAVYFGYDALKNLKEFNVDEGRGFAMAGVVIGSMGLVAQVFYTLYVMKSGLSFLS